MGVTAELESSAGVGASRKRQKKAIKKEKSCKYVNGHIYPSASHGQ